MKSFFNSHNLQKFRMFNIMVAVYCLGLATAYIKEPMGTLAYVTLTILAVLVVAQITWLTSLKRMVNNG